MIEVQTEGPVTTLRLNRPDKANALTADMLKDLRDAVRSAVHQNALILTGAGSVFSAGADLEAARAGLAISPLWEEVSAAVASFQGLSVAALNGTVAGGSFGMVLACDLRLAVPAAKFFYPVMRLGFLPQPSDPARMAALVGPARTKMILMAGQKITAQQAAAWGLIDEICNAPDLLARAYALTEPVCDAKPDHISGIRALIPDQSRN